MYRLKQKVVLDSSSAAFTETVCTPVVHKLINMESVQWTRHIATSVVRVDLRNALMPVWTKMVSWILILSTVYNIALEVQSLKCDKSPFGY